MRIPDIPDSDPAKDREIDGYNDRWQVSFSEAEVLAGVLDPQDLLFPFPQPVSLEDSPGYITRQRRRVRQATVGAQYGESETDGYPDGILPYYERWDGPLSDEQKDINTRGLALVRQKLKEARQRQQLK